MLLLQSKRRILIRFKSPGRFGCHITTELRPVCGDSRARKPSAAFCWCKMLSKRDATPLLPPGVSIEVSSALGRQAPMKTDMMNPELQEGEGSLGHPQE